MLNYILAGAVFSICECCWCVREIAREQSNLRQKSRRTCTVQ